MTAARRLVVVRNQHVDYVLESASPDDLPPMGEHITGRPPEPVRMGATFKDASRRAPAMSPLERWCARNPRLRWSLVAIFVLVLWGLAGAIAPN